MNRELDDNLVEIPWDKGWMWGDNEIQRWCDEYCEGNYWASKFSPGIVRAFFEKEKDAMLFILKWAK